MRKRTRPATSTRTSPPASILASTYEIVPEKGKVQKKLCGKEPKKRGHGDLYQSSFRSADY